MFKMVVGGVAVLAGYVVRDLGRTYGAAASAFDDRMAEDAADMGLRRPQQSADKQATTRLLIGHGSRGRQEGIPGWLDVPTCQSQRLR